MMHQMRKQLSFLNASRLFALYLRFQLSAFALSVPFSTTLEVNWGPFHASTIEITVSSSHSAIRSPPCWRLGNSWEISHVESRKYSFFSQLTPSRQTGVAPPEVQTTSLAFAPYNRFDSPSNFWSRLRKRHGHISSLAAKYLMNNIIFHRPSNISASPQRMVCHTASSHPNRASSS